MEAIVFVLGIGTGLLVAAIRPHTDALTGLYTRQAIPGWLFWHRGHIAAMVADLNGLKRINDSSGHAAGDAAIAGLARCIRSVVRRGDLVVRHGGDEFLVLARTAHATTLAGRIRSACREVGLAVAVGGASGQRHDLATLIAHADREMYREKGALRNAGD